MESIAASAPFSFVLCIQFTHFGFSIISFLFLLGVPCVVTCVKPQTHGPQKKLTKQKPNRRENKTDGPQTTGFLKRPSVRSRLRSPSVLGAADGNFETAATGGASFLFESSIMVRVGNAEACERSTVEITRGPDKVASTVDKRAHSSRQRKCP